MDPKAVWLILHVARKTRDIMLHPGFRGQKSPIVVLLGQRSSAPDVHVPGIPKTARPQRHSDAVTQAVDHQGFQDETQPQLVGNDIETKETNKRDRTQSDLDR